MKHEPRLLSLSVEFREDGEGGQDMRVTVTGLPVNYEIDVLADRVCEAVVARLNATGHILSAHVRPGSSTQH